MALSDAVLAIADAMEREADEPSSESNHTGRLIRSFARELRTAVKAAEGPHNPLLGLALADTSGEAYHRQQIEAAKKKLRQEREKTSVQEKDSAQMVEIRGGALDGTLHAVQASDLKMGMGHRMANECYLVKRDGDGVWLEFSEAETAKLNQ